MEKKNRLRLNGLYLASVLLLMFVFPAISVGIEYWNNSGQFSFINITGKWFVFYSIGLRLFTAGLKQVINPSFTARAIFHIQNDEGNVIVKELGFANICFGIMGIISLIIPHWRIVAACTGGLFFGIAGVNHLIKKPVGTNEWIALISDVFIFLVMTFYIISTAL